MNLSIGNNWLKFYNLLLDSNMDSFIAKVFIFYFTLKTLAKTTKDAKYKL